MGQPYSLPVSYVQSIKPKELFSINLNDLIFNNYFRILTFFLNFRIEKISQNL